MYVILRYHGKHLPLSEVMHKLRTDPEGTSTNAMRRILHKERLTIKILADAQLQDLRRAINQGHPVIVSTEEGGHWSVVYGYSTGHIFVSDSSLRTGLRCRMPVARFRKQWDRWMMLVEQ